MVVRRAHEQGMTLVELMVTMVIASIVAASTYMFFAGQQRVYETQTKMLNVQQNAWAAMEVLTRFVRSAGSGMYGCVRPVGGIVASLPLNRTPANVNPDDSDDPPVALTTAPVSPIHDLSRPPNAGLRANVGGNMQRIPPLWIVDQVVDDGTTTTGIVPGTDVITVAFGNRSSGTTFDSPLAANVTSANETITIPATNAAMFQPGECVVLVGEPGMGSVVFGSASDIGCTLFQITSLAAGSTSTTLAHASGNSGACPPPPITPSTGCAAGSIWNPSAVLAPMIPWNGYGALSGSNNPNTGVRNFGEFWWVSFAVRTKDKAGNYLSNQGITGQTHDIPVLTMERLDGSTPTGPQVLAEGIEDLQVAYACDLNNDGVLTATSNNATDEWKLDNASDVILLNRAAKCNQPSAVRLTLVARSLTEDNGIDAALTDNGRPAIENHAAHAPNPYPTNCNDPVVWNGNNFQDQFRRRVLTTTVYPRNN